MNRNSTEWVTRAVYDGLKEEIETLRAELEAAERALVKADRVAQIFDSFATREYQEARAAMNSNNNKENEE